MSAENVTAQLSRLGCYMAMMEAPISDRPFGMVLSRQAPFPVDLGPASNLLPTASTKLSVAALDDPRYPQGLSTASPQSGHNGGRNRAADTNFVEVDVHAPPMMQVSRPHTSEAQP